MVARLIFLILAVCALAALLSYLQRTSGSGETEASAAQTAAPEPGLVAIGAQIIQTGDDGRPLYRLDSSHISQPVASGTIFLTDPILHYTPAGGNPWVLTALQGQLPQSAQSADLSGSVHAEGVPQDSSQLVRFDTSTLHVDMQQQLATTSAVVHVEQGGDLLTGRGMRANLKSGQFELFRDVSGVLMH
ncbi:MAG TPA: LPS export ABC transporter periplasmic protein LptC [Steroidobacteraceae bacterium]|nr:LPS export ABC transporter periplasmic protein LptC [Steroidobacteraceae bacterium]